MMFMKIKNLSLLRILSISFKNLFRHARRVIITAWAITMGLTAYLAIYSLIEGLTQMSLRGVAEYEIGLIRIMKEGYWKDREFYPMDQNVIQVKTIEKKLDQIPEITHTRRLETKAEFLFYQGDDTFKEDGNINLILNGIEIPNDEKVYHLKKNVKKGKYFETPEDDGIIIGSWVADDIGAKIGYPIRIKAKTKDGSYTIIDTFIKGIIETDDDQINRNYAFIPYKILDDYLYMEGEVSNISIDINKLNAFANKKLIAKTLKKIKEALKGIDHLEIFSFTELVDDFILASNGDKSMVLVLVLAIIAIAGIGISNTMMMSVVERTKEISVLKILGMKNSEIRIMFTFEAFFIGVLGTIGGMILGNAVYLFLSIHGIDISAVFRKLDTPMGYRVGGRIKGATNTFIIVSAIVTGMLLPWIIGYFTSNKISKLNILDGIRDEN